jgi:hypothetical protein
LFSFLLASTNEKKNTCDTCVWQTGLFHLTWSYPFSSTWHNFIFLNGQIKIHSVNTPHFLYPFINWWADSIIWLLWIVPWRKPNNTMAVWDQWRNSKSEDELENFN